MTNVGTAFFLSVSLEHSVRTLFQGDSGHPLFSRPLQCGYGIHLLYSYTPLSQSVCLLGFSPPPGWWFLSFDMQSHWLCGLQFSCVCVCVCVLFRVWLFTDPMDSSPPSSSVHGILQARILEWVAISFSRIFPTQGLKLRLLILLHWQVDSLALAPPGKPLQFS